MNPRSTRSRRGNRCRWTAAGGDWRRLTAAGGDWRRLPLPYPPESSPRPRPSSPPSRPPRRREVERRQELERRRKDKELKRGEVEADKDKMMREYRAQLDAERAQKPGRGRDVTKSKSSSKKEVHRRVLTHHQNHQAVMTRTGVQESLDPVQDQREVRRIRSTGQDPSRLRVIARRKDPSVSRNSLEMQRNRCYIDTPKTNWLAPEVA